MVDQSRDQPLLATGRKLSLSFDPVVSASTGFNFSNKASYLLEFWSCFFKLSRVSISLNVLDWTKVYLLLNSLQIIFYKIHISVHNTWQCEFQILFQICSHPQWLTFSKPLCLAWSTFDCCQSAMLWLFYFQNLIQFCLT